MSFFIILKDIDRIIRRELLFVAFSLLVTMNYTYGATENLFGTYVGVLKHNKLKVDQLAKLDFIVSRKENNKLYIMAVLKLYFGDFNSHEYLSYHYHNVNYDLLTGKLVFDQSDQDLTVISDIFFKGKLNAKVRSKLSGFVGSLEMIKGNKFKPNRKIIPQLSGTYEGICGEKKSYLKLTTFKSTEDTLRTGNPYGSYRIEGNIAQSINGLCPNSGNYPCITNSITSGSYNYFSGNLMLVGKRKTLNCHASVDGISCDICNFKPTNENKPSDNPYEYPSSVKALDIRSSPAIKPSIPSIQGEYIGYLHHEYLNKYQKGSINLVAYQENTDETIKKFKMSVVANLYFGNINDHELISYRFTEKEYNILGHQFVLERAQDDVDAVLEITSIKKDAIEGVWYSLIFGRVGTFKFLKSKNVNIHNKRLEFKKIKGRYVTDKAELELSVYLDRTPVNTENPFFPLEFSGNFRYKGGLHEKFTIMGGSYDFYTGKIGLQFNHDDRSLVGQYDISSGEFNNFSWSFKHFGAPFNTNFSFLFKRQPN